MVCPDQTPKQNLAELLKIMSAFAHVIGPYNYNWKIIGGVVQGKNIEIKMP